jgi:hypothetical protein
MFDLINFFIGKEVAKISANSIDSSYYSKNDNFSVQIKYVDGSIANLIYTTEGNSKLPKEYIEVFAEGKAYIINNFKTMKVAGGKGSINYAKPNQGHLEELKTMAKSLNENFFPISIPELIQASKVSFEIQKQINQK